MRKKIWLIVACLLLALTIVGLAGCSPGNAASVEASGLSISNQQQGIWVTGQGKVSAVPDIATLTLGIEAQEESVAKAQTKAAEAMNQVIAVLTTNGVAEKDIQTQYFNIRQVTRWDREKEQEVVIGYRVTNRVTVKIRDIDNIGPIIDAVAEAGGDLTRIDGIGFSVDDPSAYYEEARKEAMVEAKARAEQLAELAGVTLGKPTYISEGMQVPPIARSVVVVEKAVGAPTPISPGEVEISLIVQVTYAILH